MLKFKVILWTFVFFICCAVANGKVLFVDDFEEGKIDEELLNWEPMDYKQNKSHPTIAEDPQDPGNKVAKSTGIWVYLPIANGRENWSDYVWDFDWMWEGNDFVGTLYRVENPDAFYHVSRRKNSVDFKLYTYNGNFAEIATGKYPNENNVWYSHRLILKGAKHELYIKERGDDTPFDELGPIAVAEDDTYKSGPVGMMGDGGTVNGATYFDNIVVAETVQDIESLAVEYHGKLTTTWAQIKD